MLCQKFLLATKVVVKHLMKTLISDGSIYDFQPWGERDLTNATCVS
jgi:hypothetical protein